MRAAVRDWLRTAKIERAVYTPQELERISGLGADMQRVWRRRGQLPASGSGHARFSIEQVIETTVRVMLSKRGIPPGEIILDLTGAASGAMYHSVFWHGGVEVIGPATEVERFLSHFEGDQGQLGSFLVGDPKRSNYMVFNERRHVRIVDDPHDLVSYDEENVIVFNLALLGARLVERGRKPVVIVNFPDQKGVRTIRRLTGLSVDR